MNSKPLSFSQISNIAVFKTESSNEARDYLTAFDKLFLTLIRINRYNNFSTYDILNDFYDFYCLRLTNMFVSEFMKRLCAQGYLKRRSDDFVVLEDSFKDKNFIKEYEDTKNAINLFNSRFIDFCLSKEVQIDSEEAETVICDYIEASVQQASIKNTLSDGFSGTQKHYLFGCFLREIESNNSELFETYKKISLGRIFASVMVENDIFSTENNLCYKDLNVYLDSDFMFNALGLNPVGYNEEYLDMIAALKRLGAKLYIFSHTYSEMASIISNAIDWIDNYQYDPLYASKTAIYFVNNHISKDEAKERYYELENSIRKLGIEIDNDFSINYNEKDNLYLQEILDKIKEEYHAKTMPASSPYDDREMTYDCDAKSLYSIHKKRKGHRASRLKDVGYIFVTHNKALCKVAQIINKEKFESKTVPYAMSDSLLNVLLWFNTKQYEDKANLMFLIPSAYYAFEPTTALLEKMHKVFDELQSKCVMSAQAIYDWKSNQILQQNIVSYTMNDPDRFDENTPTAIIKSKTIELENTISAQKKSAKETLKPYEEECDKKIAKKKKHLRLVSSILPAVIIYGSIVIISFGLLVGLFFLLSIGDKIHLILKVIFEVFVLIIETTTTILLSTKNRFISKMRYKLGNRLGKKTSAEIQELNDEKDKLKKLHS